MSLDYLNKNHFKLAGILIVAFTLRLIFFYGISPGDPFTYSLSALEIAQGHWNPGYFYEQTTRWGLLFPLAVSYQIFGVNDFSSTLWVMLTSLGVVVVGYIMGAYLQGERAGLLAAGLLAIFPLEIIFASQPMADVPLSFFLLTSLYYFLRADESNIIRIQRWLFLVSGIALGFAYATKFVAILITPFFLLVLLFRRRIEWNWIWLVAGFLIIFALECFIFQQVSGNGLMRLDLVLHDQASHAPVTAGSFNVQNSGWLYFYWMLVDFHYVGLSFIILLLMIIQRGFKYGQEKQNVFGKCRVPLLWSLTLLLILTFYPVSINPYIPLYKIEAYMLMYTAPLLVILAVFLSSYSNKIQLIIVTLLIVSSLPLLYLLHESYRAYGDNARAIFAFYQTHHDRPLYVHRSDQRFLQYFAGFQDNNSFKNFRLAKPEVDVHTTDPVNFQHTYVAINQYFLDYHSEDTYPAEINSPPPAWREVYRYQRPENWLRRLIERITSSLHRNNILREDRAQKINTKIANWSHTKPVIIYATD